MRPFARTLLVAATLASLGVAFDVAAHHVAKVDPPRRTALATDPVVAKVGVVSSIVVENRVNDTRQEYAVLTADDGTRYLLQGATAASLRKGATYAIDGRLNGQQVYIDGFSAIQANTQKAAGAKLTVDGYLRLGHADNFDGTPSSFFYAVANDKEQRWVTFATLLDGLENGTPAVVSGEVQSDGSVFADRIVITGPATVKPVDGPLASAVTTSYLVMPVKFPTNTTPPYTYGADPFTVASLRSSMFDPLPTKSVAEFYKEASYGMQLLSGAVADNGSGGFLLANAAKPATCDINAIANAAEAAATARGYNLNAYAGRVYVFNNVSGCGWSGLAYVGWARSYINNTTNLLVIGHEIGHNFGLLHAASLDCGTSVIGGTCTSSEYGDPFNTMGNQRAMHFASAQKDLLGWLPAGTVVDHKGGVATYTLNTLENGGGSRYAVRIPAGPKRMYWIEYRQPVGFDAGLASFPNNGVQVRVETPFESICSGCSDDTEFLDMTPATSAFTDGSLVVGQNYVDAQYGITVTAVSQPAGGLTVTVASPTRPTFGDVPATHPNYLDVETLYWYGITKGCSGAPMLYCPTNTVTRAELAVFIERAKRGASFVGTATGSPFADVPAGHWAGGQIEQLYADGITAGCSSAPRLFCPDGKVTRAEMAVFLMRSRYGSAYNPGTATGTVFADVPVAYWASAWIERANQNGVMTRCATGPTRFCPDQYVTRAEMAPLLRSTFSLTAAPL